MVTKKIKELALNKAKVAALEKSIASELNKELASLPGQYGFETIDEFVAAVKAAAGAKVRGGPKAKAAAKPAAAKGGEKKRRKRAVITAETKAKVKSLVEGGKTGSQIAKEVGISLPSVQNIKKELGLVKARK